MTKQNTFYLKKQENMPKQLMVLFLIFSTTLFPRSVFREGDPRQAYITIQEDYQETFTFKNRYLQYRPLFETFDKSFFFNHLLPKKSITFRHNRHKSVSGKHLSKLIETVIPEIFSGKSEFKHFTVVKKRNFHQKTKSGLLVLKFKEFPFILKLSIERPETFIQPEKKGLMPTCMFIMGGTSRHLAGFTRISNLEWVKNTINQNPYWKKRLDVPRKWFWVPKKGRWLNIVGYNMDDTPCNIHIPSIYGVVADEVKGETLVLKDPADRQLCITLCNFFNQTIDAQLFNFLVEPLTGKLVLIDTEYFPLQICDYEPKTPRKNYKERNRHLCSLFLQSAFGRNKTEQFKLQKPPKKEKF